MTVGRAVQSHAGKYYLHKGMYIISPLESVHHFEVGLSSAHFNTSNRAVERNDLSNMWYVSSVKLTANRPINVGPHVGYEVDCGDWYHIRPKPLHVIIDNVVPPIRPPSRGYDTLESDRPSLWLPRGGYTWY